MTKMALKKIVEYMENNRSWAYEKLYEEQQQTTAIFVNGDGVLRA